MAEPTPEIPYSHHELFGTGPQRTFSGDALSEIAFPLGGIGTGCISLGGRGQLRDWEIFNRPNMGFRPPHTFALVRAQAEGGRPVVKVLESTPPPPYSNPHGFAGGTGAGLPHLQANTFRGEYPFAWLEFEDDDLPVQVSLEAFNPFIPLNDLDSGIPVAVLTYRVENPGPRPAETLIVWRLHNVLGYDGAGRLRHEELGGNRNTFRAEDGLRGMVLDATRYPEDSHRYGTMVLATTCPKATYAGSAGGHSMWRRLERDDTLGDEELSEPTEEGKSATAALGARVALAPGESAEVTFLVAWHFPVHRFTKTHPDSDELPTWRNFYAQRFEDAWAVARYTADNLERLHGETRAYHDALFGSTLPAQVLDAASSQTSTLKSCTCLRLEDGTFYAWEGCSPAGGCCFGSCTHVWNYQQALPFLFPGLERSMRTAHYRYNLREEDGKMCFRIEVPLGNSHWRFHAAADGQLGGIIKTYRDWLICGDDEWLRELWPRVKKSLSYAWVEWDADEDGVPEGVQHNTYDIEFHGPNPLIGAFYLGALRAGEEMARHLGDEAAAERYRKLFEKGSAAQEEMLFNGDYFVQKHDPAETEAMQFGKGCLSDQMLGQWMAAICDLGYLLEPEHVRSALRSVFRHNWRPTLAEHVSFARIYALDGEAGLLMMSWPRGGRPEVPTMYSDEVWTGIEYQVASHLITEGMVEEGLAIVKGARDRHDGRKRNPWDEPECGSHYARAMSSWGLILALSGYFCDASRGLLRFAPRVNAADFRTFWSNDAGWGTYAQSLSDDGGELRLEVLYGEQELRVLQLELPDGVGQARAELGGESVPCTIEGDGEWAELQFGEAVSIERGQVLTVRWSG
ncbi:MAG: GH116 family glycosyl-hydrolase [Candidatus Brocadiia bacterium]